jgi:hypothetical protein
MTITVPLEVEGKQTSEDKESGLFTFLAGHIGVIDGTSETLSENCGQRFSEELLKQQRERS